jgi:CTP:molybdopterin cytidylyltransferase MocA
VFHRRTVAAIASISGDRGAQSVIETYSGALHEFSATNGAGSYDIDTPEEYQAYLAHANR